MSEVTDTVAAYRGGSLDLAELVRRLGERMYRSSTRDVSPERPTDPDTLADWLDRPWPLEEGTWYEVECLPSFGLLTSEELVAVAQAHEDWRRAGSP